jgi:hypothetical protein
VQINCVCVAEWDAKIGLQSANVRALALSSIQPGGGVVPCVRGVVQRVYPVVFMETLPDGGKVGLGFRV